jgi:hypothetical protein
MIRRLRNISISIDMGMMTSTIVRKGGGLMIWKKTTAHQEGGEETAGIGRIRLSTADLALLDVNDIGHLLFVSMRNLPDSVNGLDHSLPVAMTLMCTVVAVSSDHPRHGVIPVRLHQSLGGVPDHLDSHRVDDP